MLHVALPAVIPHSDSSSAMNQHPNTGSSAWMSSAAWMMWVSSQFRCGTRSVFPLWNDIVRGKVEGEREHSPDTPCREASLFWVVVPRQIGHRPAHHLRLRVEQPDPLRASLSSLDSSLVTQRRFQSST